LAEAIKYRVFKAIPRCIVDRYYDKARGMIFEFVLLGAFMVPGEPMLLWDWFLSMRVSRRRKALIKAHHER
jgi:hypothetical protein